MPAVEIRGSHLSARVTVSIRQDTMGNRSTLRVTGLELRNEWGEIGSAYVTGTISINGSQGAKLTLGNTYGCGVTFAKGSWCGVGLGSGADISSVTVSHGSDGVCPPVSVSVSLSAKSASGSQSYGSLSGSGAVSLPDIPRVTEITASGVTLGTAMDIALSRASEVFRDTVSWQCGGKNGVIAEKTGANSLTWTPPLSLAEENPQGSSVEIVLTVTTYSGDTAIGSKSVTVRCSIPDGEAPTLSITVTDKTGCYDRYGSFVRSRSQARVVTAASGVYGSTIQSIMVSCGGLTGSGADAVFSLPDPGTVTVQVTVTDSRGRSASGSKTVTVADYQSPSASITSLCRCGSDGTPDPQGAYGKAAFTGTVTSLAGKNSAAYKLKKRVRGTDTWDMLELTGYTGQFTPQGEAVFAAGIDDDLEVCVCAGDDFTETNSPVAVLPVAFSLLDFHRGSKSVGILQRASTAGAVDIGGDTVHHGHRLRDVGEPKEAGDGVTLGYLQKCIKQLLGAAYPVGSIYLTVSETSPASLFGGTWERLKDRFLLAAGDTYAPGATGGEANHTLTVEEMPSHVPSWKGRATQGTIGGSGYTYALFGTDDTGSLIAQGKGPQPVGGDQPHNNMPPYLAVYMWKRTA